MAILQIQMDFAGQSGVYPRKGSIVTDSNLAAVTSVNWLKQATSSGYTFYSTDFIAIAYNGGSAWFSPTIDSNGNITLVAKDAPDGVVVDGSVESGNIVQFAGPNSIEDAGFKIVQGISPVFEGGSTSYTFAAPGVVAFSNIIANMRSYDNPDTLLVLCSSTVDGQINAEFNQDPGVSTSINYVSFS